MPASRILALALLLAAAARGQGDLPPQGAAQTGSYRNLFSEYLGKSEAEVDSRIDSSWRQLFHGNPDTQSLYYPQPDGTAYVPDVANNDVRTEGLSYGMMICVQLDHREEFDRIWRFARKHLLHRDGPLRGYFAWHATFEGRPLSEGPAPDGEEWFTMALFFASHRWGDGSGDRNYGAEAQAILHEMLHKHEEADRGAVTDMFDRGAGQIVFAPGAGAAGFTDPSYHLPAFYELWARWAADRGDREFMARAARESRRLFGRSAHPATGLMPDYATFEGTPRSLRAPGHEDFRFDAWRTLSNPALDYSWWAADPAEVLQSNRVLGFLASHGPHIPDLYKVDGTPISSSVDASGLAAMAATAALAADREVGQAFVRKLWETPLPEGHYRYYNGLLMMLGLLEVGGRFRIHAPPAAP
jgi:oligosaccharide reducing-end xylanase